MIRFEEAEGAKKASESTEPILDDSKIKLFYNPGPAQGLQGSNSAPAALQASPNKKTNKVYVDNDLKKQMEQKKEEEARRKKKLNDLNSELLS